jgi:hypothetical protein
VAKSAKEPEHQTITKRVDRVGRMLTPKSFSQTFFICLDLPQCARYSALGSALPSNLTTAP